MIVRIGLPDSTGGVFAQTAQALCAPTMISVGALRRRGAFTRIGPAAWATDSALDSAGFVAMKQGGYRFSVDEYVDFVVTNGGDGAMPHPWSFWSSMDYCVEPEIAETRGEVNRRIDKTTETLGEVLDAVDWWRDEGDTDTPDPMPILQGWTPTDYLRSWRGTVAMLESRGRPMPSLFGVGSVCRRRVRGSEGLLHVVGLLHAVLPLEAKLHLFGVKGSALEHLRAFGGRIHSVDSMAWSYAARFGLKNQPRPREACARYMRDWYLAQQR